MRFCWSFIELTGRRSYSSTPWKDREEDFQSSRILFSARSWRGWWWSQTRCDVIRVLSSWSPSIEEARGLVRSRRKEGSEIEFERSILFSSSCSFTVFPLRHALNTHSSVSTRLDNCQTLFSSTAMSGFEIVRAAQNCSRKQSGLCVERKISIANNGLTG